MFRLRVYYSLPEMMKICSPDMKPWALIIVMINSFCAFSQVPNELLYVVGCFENGTTEVQFEFNDEKILYVDFDREEVVYTLPRFIIEDPSTLFENLHLFKNAKKAQRTCPQLLEFCKVDERNPPEEMDAPESILYPSEEVQLGVENTLVCFVNHFYPPKIKVSWTMNDHPVSEGVSLSRYYPNKDQTFNQFSTLKITPREGDIYSCTVEHLALDSPQTRTWDHEFSHPSLGPDIYCAVCLALGLLGVAAGTFFMVKGLHRH